MKQSASEIREQIKWWKRQQCLAGRGCQLESEIPGFIDIVEKLLAVYEAAHSCLDDSLRFSSHPSAYTLAKAVARIQTRRDKESCLGCHGGSVHHTCGKLPDADDSRRGLPGTENCSNDWHRMKFVSTDHCPDCEMTVAEVNIELRKRAGEGQKPNHIECKH